MRAVERLTPYACPLGIAFHVDDAVLTRGAPGTLGSRGPAARCIFWHAKKAVALIARLAGSIHDPVDATSFETVTLAADSSWWAVESHAFRLHAFVFYAYFLWGAGIGTVSRIAFRVGAGFSKDALHANA